MKSTIRLGRTYDAERLRRDLEAARRAGQFIVNGPAEINGKPYHDGRWKAIALVSLDGRTDAKALRWAGTHANYQKTPIVKDTPYFEEIIDSFKCPLQRVRLLQLDPGAQIHEHSDLGDSWAMRKVRLHIPIVTHDEVYFYVEGKRIVMREGELWYCDFSRPHRVHNAGASSRIHMVLDLTVDPWLQTLFPPEPLIERAQGFLQRTRFDGEARLRGLARAVGLARVKHMIFGALPRKPDAPDKFD